jgi:translation initiation factor 2 alpha subunit (eIF-2alpha)
MAERKPQWPEAGDLVIATVQTVTDYGAYAKLDGYGQGGLLQVSEILSSWRQNVVACIAKSGGQGTFRREK